MFTEEIALEEFKYLSLGDKRLEERCRIIFSSFLK
jgi:hypothetical protein